jgi:UDP-N-acetylmuramoylalanine--D-glutamate ligase
MKTLVFQINLYGKLFEKRIPVISEIEFAAAFTDATIIGIAGNGRRPHYQ